MLETFVHKITLALDVLAPVKRVVVSSKNRAVWLSEETKESIARRQSQREKAAMTGLEQDWIEFRRLRNETTAKVRKDKMKFMEDQLKPDQDPKNLWSNLKKLSGVSLTSQSTIAILHNNEVIKSPKTLSNLFNDFFIEKVEKIVKICPPNINSALIYTSNHVGNNKPPEMEFSTVTTEKVLKIINSLKNTGSTGTDGINTLTIKKLKDILVGPLTEIINKAIYSCDYPRLWKEGLITPLPKKGDLTLMSSWRPVTILNL